MATAIIKFALISASFAVSINGQFLTRVVGVENIISLLDNVTDTCNTMSVIANTLHQSADTQTRIEDTLDRVANTQSQIAVALTRMATTQSQMATTQTQLADALTQMATTQTQMATTQTQMVTTQTQMATTQTQMAGTLSQVVEQLQNIKDMVGQLFTQNQSQQLENVTPTKTQQQCTSPVPPDMPRDCADLLSRGSNSSGSYTIRPEDDLNVIGVYCDMTTDNGGWTVFQRRFDGSVDFYLGWEDYEGGFGNQDGEHWMGLRKLRTLTRQGSWTLRIDLEAFNGDTAHAVYTSFSIGDAASFYRLSIGEYSGTAGDSLRRHNGHSFSTKDSDHDTTVINCATSYKGAWWYHNCLASNLNGLYIGEAQINSRGMTWRDTWKGTEVLKRSSMKIRRIC